MSQAPFCAQCQAYRKSCQEGSPPDGVLLPKKCWVIVVNNNNNDNDDEPPKPWPLEKPDSKRKGKKRAWEQREANVLGLRWQGSVNKVEFLVPPDLPQLCSKGEWVKLEEALQTFSVQDLLVWLIVQTAQLWAALTPWSARSAT